MESGRLSGEVPPNLFKFLRMAGRTKTQSQGERIIGIVGEVESWAPLLD
jgi:hypothetical protein